MRSVLLLLGVLFVTPVPAQEWWFWPDYTLGQKAQNFPGNRIEAPLSAVTNVRLETVPLVFHGEEPTGRIEDFLDRSKLPQGNFSVELWLVNHVNKPVGALVASRSERQGEEPDWLLGMYERSIIYSLRTADEPFATLITHDVKTRGWKNYWFHVVATYEGNSMNLYVNGERIHSAAVGKRRSSEGSLHHLEGAAYMKNEPYMDFGNLVKMLRIHDRALTPPEVTKSFDVLKNMTVEGKLYPDLFHFNAGPYLNYATQNSISILWETDRPADFVVEYGTGVPLDKKVVLNSQQIKTEKATGTESNIYEVTLKDLAPETPYFYNIKAVARDGATMESGVLTFTSAVKDNNAYSFAVVGDTEARPHINDRVAKLIWDERPSFLVIVGDLTDGGKEDHKFEWNYEYFQAITQLASRVPVFPVAGNGEDDLHWYTRYHALPSPEGYYSFVYGNAEFFMLNSNKPGEFAPGGKQYVWLEEKLQRSTARWKFVAHHHAPYSADDDDYGDSWKGNGEFGDKAIRKIVPLYEKYGVDMVFFGHLHTYQRTLPIKENIVDSKNGVIYVQGGGGGGNLEDFAPSRAWFSAKTYRGHHYFTVTVHGGELNFRMYDSEGRLKDLLDLSK